MSGYFALVLVKCWFQNKVTTSVHSKPYKNYTVYYIFYTVYSICTNFGGDLCPPGHPLVVPMYSSLRLKAIFAFNLMRFSSFYSVLLSWSGEVWKLSCKLKYPNIHPLFGPVISVVYFTGRRDASCGVLLVCCSKVSIFNLMKGNKLSGLNTV